jgi:hypothetical protein
MKSFDSLRKIRGIEQNLCAAFSAISAALFFAISSAGTASAQAVPSGYQGGLTLSAGGTASGYIIGYGDRKMVGPAVFVDADTRLHFGVEGEARWLMFNQTAGVHDTTWLIGPRYTIFPLNKRWYPYVKGMVGIGQFTFPYGYAKGSYLVLAPGGGLDYRVSRRIRIRVVDFEYQVWPQFTYGNLPSYGIGSGIRVRIF